MYLQGHLNKLLIYYKVSLTADVTGAFPRAWFPGYIVVYLTTHRAHYYEILGGQHKLFPTRLQS